MSPLRILHVDTGLEMRGGQWQVDRLVRGLLQRGHDCLLLAPAGSPLHGRGLPTAPLGRRWPKADLIHAHDSRGHSWALLRPQPLVVSRRVAFPRRQNILGRAKYSRVRRFIAISEYVRSVLIREGVPAAKIGVVPDGVPLLPPSRLEPGVVITPASADPRKGGALAAAWTPSDSLERDLARASVLVYLSEAEGLGSAALLAQAAGVPVVASRVGGLPEAIADGETGLLVNNEPEEIAAAVRSIMEDSERLIRFSQAARERAARLFSVDRMVDRTLEEYAQALA